MYEFFGGAGSPNSLRAFPADEIKGLEYECRKLAFSKQEYLTPVMLAASQYSVQQYLSFELERLNFIH